MARSSEDVERRYIDVMGPSLGLLYSRLWADCTHLHMTWGEYLVLFGTSEENVKLLNQAAPAFARMMQDALWENVLMHMCRLVDNRTTMGKDNLTLKRLPELLSGDLRALVLDAISDVSIKCEFARDWRNKRISHSDLDLCIGSASLPLAGASRANVREALKSLAKALNLIEYHFTESEVVYDFIRPAGGSDLLLHIIKAGIKAEAGRKSRLLNGSFTADDLE